MRSQLVIGKKIALALTAIIALSCGKKEDEETTDSAAEKNSGEAALSGSCTIETDSTKMCMEYSDLTSDWKTAAESSCADSSGTWSASEACSSTDRVGVCTVAANEADQTPEYSISMYAPFTAATGEASCTNTFSGTFTAD